MCEGAIGPREMRGTGAVLVTKRLPPSNTRATSSTWASRPATTWRTPSETRGVGRRRGGRPKGLLVAVVR